MKEQILVCPFDENLFARIHNKRIVVIASDPEQIQRICQVVGDNQNNLHCLVFHLKGSIASVPFHESWRGIPIAIYASEMGPFKEIMGKLPLIRDLNIRIFLSSDSESNYTNLHILASLGIDCGIYFADKEKINWESLNDLMTYSVYGKVNHASIEPFNFLASHYNPGQMTDFSSVYFENPQMYLHIDANENIALTSEDLKNENFVLQGLDKLNQVFDNEKFQETIHSWQQYFLQKEGCAYCQAWRVCMGKFSESYEKNQGCRQFFADMMDAADHFLSLQHQNKRKELWQP
jgi:radical SAM protein with 4Fe4S-binding SPASM domain